VFSRLGYRDLTGDVDRAQAVGGGANLSFTTMVDQVDAWKFTAAATISQRLSVKYHVDHDVYLDSPDGYFHVHTVPATAGQSGVSVWKLQYSIARGHSRGAFTSTSTITLNVTTHAGDRTHQITEVAVPISLLEPDTMVRGSVYRDGADPNDTDPGAIFLVEADFHYRTDRWATLNKSYPFEP
jgi:hypothetical protein